MTRSSRDASERRSDGRAPAGEADAAEQLRQAVRAARARPEMLAEIRRVLDGADRADADSPGRPRCLGGGACCRFDLMGHRVYVSTGELALLASTPPPAPQRAAAGRCPYQVGPACRGRSDRPLGCRVYFCRDRDGDEQARRYEVAHAAIREIHARHGVCYLYVELTGAVAALGEGAAANC